MAKVSTTYASRFVKPFELSYTDRRLAMIDKVTTEVFGNDFIEKLVITIDDGKGWVRDIVLNQTNAQRLAATFGDESNDWVGQQVELWVTGVVYQGQTMPSVQIGAGAAPSLPAPTRLPIKDELDDEISF